MLNNTVKVYNALALDNGVLTEGHLTKIDFGGLATVTREFTVDMEITENAVSGSATTVTVNYYWSDKNLDAGTFQANPNTDAERILQLAAKKIAGTVATRPNTVSARRFFPVVAAVTRPIARYLYFSITKQADTGGTSGATLTLNVNRVPAQNPMIVP